MTVQIILAVIATCVFVAVILIGLKPSKKKLPSDYSVEEFQKLWKVAVRYSYLYGVHIATCQFQGQEVSSTGESSYIAVRGLQTRIARKSLIKSNAKESP